MADLTITAANVAKGTGAQTASGVAGETITAGQTLYVLAADSRLYKADANASAAASTLVGIALHASLAGQPIIYQTAGPITIGATVVIGTIYVLSATAGGIAPAADLVTGWYTGIVGVATTAAIITLAINPSGVAVP